MGNVYCYPSVIGKIWIKDNHHSIIGISTKELDGNILETDLIKTCHQQLEEYFSHQRICFDFPIEFHDTPFREKCYQALLQIPYGNTWSYKELAIAVGNPKASCAVGQAIHHNPLLIVIPCHRIIQSNGSLGGFGAGTDTKIKLLSIEKDTEI